MSTREITAAEPLLAGELVSLNAYGQAIKGHVNPIGIALEGSTVGQPVCIATSDVDFYNPNLGMPQSPSDFNRTWSQQRAEYERRRRQRETPTLPPMEILRMLDRGQSPLLPPVITYTFDDEDFYEIKRHHRHPINRIREPLLDCGYRLLIDDDHARHAKVITFHKNPRDHARDLAAYYGQQTPSETTRQVEDNSYTPPFTSWGGPARDFVNSERVDALRELTRDFGALSTHAADANDANDALRELARQVGLSPAPQPSPAPPPVKHLPTPPPALPLFTPKPRRISA